MTTRAQGEGEGGAAAPADAGARAGADSEYQPLRARRNDCGLCLSGGGFRAALFHLGSLRRLNEAGLLSRMETVSSVSGGSIVNGLLARAWPRLRPDASGVFTNFFEEVEEPARAFCSTNIRNGPLVWSRLSPLNLKRFLWDKESATNVLADVYAEERCLGDLRLQHLTDVREAGGPDFVFCATNFQTGANFVFNSRVAGDWKIGYTRARTLRLADAVAASSAFPVAFPPLVLGFDPALDKFQRGALKGCPEYAEITRHVLLTDGGVYDNLGLEPVWKNHRVVFCSDGGAPYGLAPDPWTSAAPRLSHSNDIINNQARAVRKRWLISSYEKKVYGGAYWGLSTDVRSYDAGAEGYRGRALELLAKVRTDLDEFSEGEQLVLMNHGWAVTKAALVKHYPQAPAPPGEPPSRALLDSPEQAELAILKSDRHLKLLRR
jgi:NTE family protein